MSRLVLALVVLGPLLALAACGGGTRSSSAATAGSASSAAPEPAAGVAAESGISGLSVAEVEAQPPAPPLPEPLLTASREEIAAEAARVADREARGKRLGTLNAQQRALYLTHSWWQLARQHQRSQASTISGLTIGELEDQPGVPPLPEIFGLGTTSEDLAHHAYLVASEEAATDVIGDNAIASRQTYLVWAWEPLLAKRQARHAAALEERQARNDYQVKDARQKARWEADIAAHQRETERLIEIERHQTIPVLSDQERAELQAITGD